MKIKCGARCEIVPGQLKSTPVDDWIEDPLSHVSLCRVCRNRNNINGCNNKAFPTGYDERMDIDPHFRRQRLEAGWGLTTAAWDITAEKCVELLKAMGWLIAVENIGVQAAGSSVEPQDFTTTPLFMQLIFLLLGLFMGMVIRDATRECVPFFRRTIKGAIKRFIRVTRSSDEQVLRELRRAQSRVNEMSQRQDAFSREHRRRTSINPPATSRSLEGGRTAGRRAGYYVPPMIDIPEDTTQNAQVNLEGLVEASAFIALASVTDTQAAEALDGLAQYALRPPARQASITSELSDPWSVISSQPQVDITPPPAEIAVLQPIVEELITAVAPSPFVVSTVLTHNIAPLEACPSMMSTIGLMSQPPCTFVSQFGQRIHLYNDGRCLSNVNVRNGVRALKALPVCLICANRWKAAGGSSSSSGLV